MQTGVRRQLKGKIKGDFQVLAGVGEQVEKPLTEIRNNKLSCTCLLWSIQKCSPGTQEKQWERERVRGLQFVIVIMVIGHKETVLIMPYLNSELSQNLVFKIYTTKFSNNLFIHILSCVLFSLVSETIGNSLMEESFLSTLVYWSCSRYSAQQKGPFVALHWNFTLHPRMKGIRERNRS